MKEDLNRITRSFLMGESYDPTVLSSIQMIFEMLNGLRITSQRDTNRIEVAKEQVVKVRRHVKRIEERNKRLEEIKEKRLSFLKQKKDKEEIEKEEDMEDDTVWESLVRLHNRPR